MTGTAKRRADYAFSLAPHFKKRPRFFVEAKRPQLDIAAADNYFQAIRYRSSLTRQLAVYNFRDYRDPETFAKIYWLFSREAAVGDAIRKYSETLERPSSSSKQIGLFPGGYQNIDDAFLGQLDQYREDLARSFKRLNPQLTRCGIRGLWRFVARM